VFAAKKAFFSLQFILEPVPFEVPVVSVSFQTFYGQMKQTKNRFLATNT